jgi:hypothetical protein
VQNDDSIFSKIRASVRRDGPYGMLYVHAFRALNRVVPFMILKGIYLEDVEPQFLKAPDGYVGMIMPEELLRRFAADPENEMSTSFLDAAKERGDRCYAILHGDKLAAYGWYARSATPIGIDDLSVCFRRDYVYMYKGFTHEAHRGKRLHALGMARAMRYFQEHGCRGLVSYVESTNFASLKSCYRMGYKAFGSIYLVKLGTRYFALSSPGCARFEFSVEQRGKLAASRTRLFEK